MGTQHTKPCPIFHDRFAFCAHFYELPVLRAITIVTMSGMFLNMLLAAYFFYTHWDFPVLIRNSFMLITVCFELLLMFEALVSSEFHFQIKDLKEEMWTFADAEPDTFQYIQNDIKFLKHTRIVVSVMLLISALVCLPITGDIREFFCILYVVEDIESASWYPYFQVMVVFLKIFFGLSLANPVFMMLTVLGDNVYSMRMLKDRITAIEKIFGRKDLWCEDRAYQKYVELTLIRCIQEHRNIRKCHQIVSKVMKRNLPSVFIVMVLFFTSLYYYIKMNLNQEVLIKFSVLITLIIFFAYLFIKVSQNLIDESNDFYRELCGCPWFLWNKSNKFRYIMFLLHTKDPLTVRFFGIDYDYSILVRLAKTTMSVLTALQTFDS